MRAILFSGDHLTGRDAADIVTAYRGTHEGAAAIPLAKWMRDTLKVWRANGYAFEDPPELTAGAFLQIMRRIGLVRRIIDTPRGGTAGLGALGAVAGAPGTSIPATIERWSPRGDHWTAELKDGREYRLYKSVYGWRVSVGYATGKDGFHYLDAKGVPGPVFREESHIFPDFPPAIRAAQANARRA